MKTLALITVLSLTASTYQQCFNQYKVQAGDICYNIAQNNGISVDQLVGLNPGLNCNALQIGQTICLNGNNNNTGGASVPPTGNTSVAPGGGSTAPTVAPSKPPTGGSCATFETVEQGELCYNIAENYGLSLDQLQGLNAGLDCNTLQIGQQLCVAGASNGGLNSLQSSLQNIAQAISESCSKSYSVAAGDICYNIAQNNGLSVDQLIGMNPGLNCNALQVGQTLCLDGSDGSKDNKTDNDFLKNVEKAKDDALKAQVSSCSRTYTVVSGDICYNIAQNNGLSVDQLVGMNPGLDCNVLQVGQNVCLG